SDLPRVLRMYDKLALYNRDYFTAQLNSAYDGIKSNTSVQRTIGTELAKALSLDFRLALTRKRRTAVAPELTLSYNEHVKELRVELSLSADDVTAIERDAYLLRATKAALKKVARYSGDFVIVSEEIPF